MEGSVSVTLTGLQEKEPPFNTSWSSCCKDRLC